jgi:hypothetical protein
MGERESVEFSTAKRVFSSGLWKRLWKSSDEAVAVVLVVQVADREIQS